ncbi:MAG: hypothetical protein EON58_05620 [Alphaproteobacteria bacterium]|nr:MAG: hypothetical protein EON58_05620 [Alphaproteobacteria bacterium]
MIFLVLWIATAIGVAAYLDRLAGLLRPFTLGFFVPPVVLTVIACVTGRLGQQIALLGLIVHAVLITFAFYRP